MSTKTRGRKKNATAGIQTGFGAYRRALIDAKQSLGCTNADVSNFLAGKKTHVSKGKWKRMQRFVDERKATPLPPSPGVETNIIRLFRDRINGITVYDALKCCHTTELRHYVARLRAKGYTITDTWRSLKEFDTYIRFKVYYLKETKK